MARRIEGTDLIMSDQLYGVLVNENLALGRFLMDSYVARAAVTTDQANYLDGGADGTISFLTRSRADRLSFDGFFTHEMLTAKNRQAASAGKVLRKILAPDALGEGVAIGYLDPDPPGRWVHPAPRVSDADIEQAAVAVQAAFRPIEAKIVVGEAIRYWYYEKNATTGERGTTLHLSCMRGATCWNSTRFYAQNPLVIGLVIALDGAGKLAGRALVWKFPGGIVMDRCYGSAQTATALKKLAAARGWVYRISDRVGETDVSVSIPIALPLQRFVPHQTMPYLDTFDIVPVHATGDRGKCVDFYGGRIEGDLDRFTDTHLLGRDNPILYAAAALKRTRLPPSHPMARGEHDPSGRRRQRDEASVRDRRVAWLTDFSWVTPWPEDLLVHDPTWTLDGWGSEPENDAANATTIPARATAAKVIAEPERQTIAGGLLPGIDAESFRHNVASLDDALRRLNTPEISDNPTNPADPQFTIRYFPTEGGG